MAKNAKRSPARTKTSSTLKNLTNKESIKRIPTLQTEKYDRNEDISVSHLQNANKKTSIDTPSEVEKIRKQRLQKTSQRITRQEEEPAMEFNLREAIIQQAILNRPYTD